MATYTCAVQTISRSAGRTSTRSAAYRHGAVIECERTGLRHDYARRSGVASSHVVGWDGDIGSLWNAAEAAERRRDSTVARELMVSLPHELTAEDREALTLRMAEAMRERFGVAVSVAIHLPGRHGDQRNHHAHLLCTTRVVDDAGVFGAKTRQLDNPNTSRGEVHWIRQTWQTLANGALERAGQDARIDARSLRARALAGEIAPAEAVRSVHLGPAAAAMERRGEATRAGDHNREVAALRAVAREAAAVAREIEGEERRLAAERGRDGAADEVDADVLTMPSLDEIEAVAMRELADQEAARLAQAQARADAIRTVRESALAAARVAAATGVDAHMTRREAANRIAQAEQTAGALCDATARVGAARIEAAGVGRAAVDAWRAERLRPRQAAVTDADAAVERARADRAAHGDRPGLLRFWARPAWDRGALALDERVTAAERGASSARTELQAAERLAAGPATGPTRADVEARARRNHVAPAECAMRDASTAHEAAVRGASTAVSEAVEAQGRAVAAAWAATRERDALAVIEPPEAAQDRDSQAFPQRAAERTRAAAQQRREDIQAIRAWRDGVRPTTDPTMRDALRRAGADSASLAAEATHEAQQAGAGASIDWEREVERLHAQAARDAPDPDGPDYAPGR